MNALEGLKQEHKLMHLLFCAFLEQVKQAEETGRLNVDVAKSFLEVIKHYSAGLHMVKEDRHLVPKLFAAGVPRDFGPLLLMGQEHCRIHDELGVLLETFERLYEGDHSVRGTFLKLVPPLVPFMRLHMLKEENSVFTLAETILTDQDHQDLRDAFSHADRVFGLERKEALEFQIFDIASRFGLQLVNGEVRPKAEMVNMRSSQFIIRSFQGA